VNSALPLFFQLRASPSAKYNSLVRMQGQDTDWLHAHIEHGNSILGWRVVTAASHSHEKGRQIALMSKERVHMLPAKIPMGLTVMV
jgi:hypothetical protein